MHFGVRIKFWFFEHYWWLLCLSIATSLSVMMYLNQPVASMITAIGMLLSLVYFLQKQKLEELRMFRELFKEFNSRYDNINEALSKIVDSDLMNVSEAERAELIDYFNLCGEEYLYFQRGYIDPLVWTAWKNGMKAIFSVPRVQQVWSREKRTESYYGLPL